jgi:membrane associated rhomboid family serine protease
LGDDDSSLRSFTFVTYLLIVINVIVFFLELSGGEDFVIRWAFIPSQFLADPLDESVTLFTSMFMHGGWIHLIGNMLYLWIFGDNVEDRFSHTPFTVFYLVCGLAATFSQLFFSMGSNIPNLGASGAIAGVLGAYIIMFPLNRVSVLGGRTVVRVPALIVIGFWFVLQLFSGASSIGNIQDTGGVAYMAHIGGFVAGCVLALIIRGVKPRR